MMVLAGEMLQNFFLSSITSLSKCIVFCRTLFATWKPKVWPQTGVGVLGSGVGHLKAGGKLCPSLDAECPESFIKYLCSFPPAKEPEVSVFCCQKGYLWFLIIHCYFPKNMVKIRILLPVVFFFFLLALQMVASKTKITQELN